METIFSLKGNGKQNRVTNQRPGLNLKVVVPLNRGLYGKGTGGTGGTVNKFKGFRWAIQVTPPQGAKPKPIGKI